MRNLFWTVALAGSLLTLHGQASPAAGQNQQPKSAASAETFATSQAPEGRSITGILMDASCQAIVDRSKSAAARDSVSSSAASPTNVRDSRSISPAAQSTATSASAYGTTGGPSNSSATGTTGAASTIASTGAASQRSPSTTTEREMPRVTESASVGTATAGPSHASATGTTGAATGTVPPQSSYNTQSGRASTTSTSAGVGERARSETGTASLNADTTVREKYAACVPKPSSTVFAIHANGTLYTLDQASNEMVGQQMRNEAFSANMSNGRDGTRWMTVTVLGTPGADNMLSIRSVRK